MTESDLRYEKHKPRPGSIFLRSDWSHHFAVLVAPPVPVQLRAQPLRLIQTTSTRLRDCAGVCENVVDAPPDSFREITHALKTINLSGESRLSLQVIVSGPGTLEGREPLETHLALCQTARCCRDAPT